MNKSVFTRKRTWVFEECDQILDLTFSQDLLYFLLHSLPWKPLGRQRYSPIANGKQIPVEKKAPIKRQNSQNEEGQLDEEMGGRQGPSKEDETKDTVVDMSAAMESSYRAPSPHDIPTTTKPKKSEQLFDRISEKATKYLPKKSAIGKLFSDKESEITIYTIDREMNRPTPQELSPRERDDGRGKKKRREESTAAEVELKEKLERVRKPGLPEGRYKTVGTWADTYPPHRLLFLPPDDWKDSESFATSASKIILCQCTLVCLLLVWIIFGALVFYLTEGPYEYDQVTQIRQDEKTLLISMATDLRLLNPQDAIWKNTIEKYLKQHRDALTKSFFKTYGNQQEFWTFSGSFMFCISLITTLGLATPLPISMGGQIGATVFALVGFPLNMVVVINLARGIALKTQLFSKELEHRLGDIRQRIMNVRRFGEDLPREKETWFIDDFKPPKWLKYFPILSIAMYYGFGLLMFGIARDMEFPRILLFWCDFADLESTTGGLARMSYAWYLEGAALLAAVNAVIWRDSPFEGITPIGIDLGFMTNSLD